MTQQPIASRFLKTGRQPVDPKESTLQQRCFAAAGENRGPQLRLQFRFQNGNRQSLGYAYLIDLTIDPSRYIEMEFSSHQVRIFGQNLMPLFDLLSEQRVRWLQEIDPLQSNLCEDSETVVTAIQVIADGA